MKTLKRFAIIVTFLLGGGLSDISSAQHTLNPRSITQLSEVFDDAEREWTYTIQDEYDRGPSLSDAGLVFVTGDSDIIQTIGRNGAIAWERRSPAGMGTVSAWASPNGRYVYLVHRAGEEGGIFEFISSDGQTLWTKDLNGRDWPQFSRNGDYILPNPNILFRNLLKWLRLERAIPYGGKTEQQSGFWKVVRIILSISRTTPFQMSP